MTKAESYFHELTAEVPDAVPGKMFGALCIKMPNGKAAAMFWKEFLLVKLQDDDFDKAMGLKGAKVFTPMEGRPMNGWVQLSFDHKNKWKELMLTAAEDVKKLEKKAPKKAVKKAATKTAPVAKKIAKKK